MRAYATRDARNTRVCDFTELKVQRFREPFLSRNPQKRFRRFRRENHCKGILTEPPARKKPSPSLSRAGSKNSPGSRLCLGGSPVRVAGLARLRDREDE